MVPISSGVNAAGYSLLYIRVKAFTVFDDEAVDSRGDNGQRYQAGLEARVEGLIHPVHQALRVFGWEILTATNAS
jgi:hypothetical protein